jgi:hypothetical protein
MLSDAIEHVLKAEQIAWNYTSALSAQVLGIG